MQMIHEPAWRELPVVDLAGLSEQEPREQAERLIHEEGRRPFDLNKGPIVRTTLIRLGSEDHVILYTIHHIASDGWSAGVMSREIAVLYEAFSARQPSPLPELPIQYADFAIWQRGWLQGDLLDEQLTYWKEQLAGMIPLELLTDHSRPAVQSFSGAMHILTFSPEVVSGLKELSRRSGVTLFMTVVAGLQALLSRYTGQEDIAVGSAIANRNHAENEKLIGFFVNALVLRTDLSGDPTVVELLARVREVTLNAYDHQDLPFEKLVNELQPERNLGRNPLVQVVIQFLNVAEAPPEWAGMVPLPGIGAAKVATRFDLELHIFEHTQGLTGWFIYNTDLFDASMIDRIARHFEQTLVNFITQPTQRVAALELVTDEESEQLDEWSMSSAITTN